MIDPKETYNAVLPRTPQGEDPSAGPVLGVSRRVLDGGLLHLIPNWDAMHFIRREDNEAEVLNLFDVQTGTEVAMLIDDLVDGSKKLLSYALRDFKFVMAMQVTHARQGGVLRVWKPTMYRPEPGVQKFFSEFAARHGCKAVHYHSAPLRSTI